MNLGAQEPLTVVPFHSMFGLRQVELSAAERLRSSGHRVVTPDLFAGATAVKEGAIPAMEDGFALMEQIGWEVIVARALAAVRDLPSSTVLGGFSMGVGVVGSVWPERLSAAGVFQLHATAPVPQGIPVGTPVQVHVADGDRFAPPEQIAALRASAKYAGAEVSLHSYPGVGHFYSDPASPGYDSHATNRTWAHLDRLLEGVRRRVSH